MQCVWCMSVAFTLPIAINGSQSYFMCYCVFFSLVVPPVTLTPPPTLSPPRAPTATTITVVLPPPHQIQTGEL